MSDRVSMRSAWGSRLGSRRLLNLAMALLGGVMLAPPAFAYRPFDGTNGEVSDPGEFELEVGSAYLTTGARYMVAPATVLNFGVAPGLELVADFKNFVGLQRVAGKPRLQLLETDIFLKRVLRRGALQGEPGVSIALEAGPLLPEINGVNAFGAQASLITSYRWDALSLHLNTAAALTREHHAEGFLGLIVEGPHDWAVRPVAEVYTEREAGYNATYSALVGAIWQVRDRLAIDAGVRHSVQTDNGTTEVRFGMTLGVGL
jgi:hypothetical protein